MKIIKFKMHIWIRFSQGRYCWPRQTWLHTTAWLWFQVMHLHRSFHQLQLCLFSVINAWLQFKNVTQQTSIFFYWSWNISNYIQSIQYRAKKGRVLKGFGIRAKTLEFWCKKICFLCFSEYVGECFTTVYVAQQNGQ